MRAFQLFVSGPNFEDLLVLTLSVSGPFVDDFLYLALGPSSTTPSVMWVQKITSMVEVTFWTHIGRNICQKVEVA